MDEAPGDKPSSISSGSSTCTCSRASVYEKTRKRTSTPRDAWLSITSFLRWKYIDSQDDVPEDLSAFRGHECLALERLLGNAQWKDVATAVYPVDTKGRYGLAVPGYLSGHGGSSSVRKKTHVVIVSDSEVERDAWMISIRIRISPWQLLYRRMKDVLMESTLTSEALREMFACAEERSTSALTESTTGPSWVVDGVSRFGLAMEGVNVLSGFVEAVATVVKKSAPLLKDTAENVADLAKCVTVVSSAFQLVALSASLVEMGSEMKRGIVEWPRLLSLVEEHRSATVRSMTLVLSSDGQIDEMLVRNVFQVQEELVNILRIVEKEAMRSGTIQSIVRFFKSGELKKAEGTVEKMKNYVLAVVQSGEIAKNSVAIADVRKRMNLGHKKNARSLLLRPKLASYFAGRHKELEDIEDILDEHGSAAIMQYGGVGKTQLMVAFAERSEKRGWVPGGCYWIRAHGNRARFVESLASFTESLTADPLSENDRRDVGVVLGILKRTLNLFTKRWLLCLDNADSNDVNEVVGELCSLARECCSTGWILVTSRQGRRTLWQGMSSRQKLKLQPLGLEQAMAVLLRWKEELSDTTMTYDLIAKKLEELKEEEPLEYQSLSRLAGDDKECGLGGLALALTQAGSFIHRRGISFSKYALLYQKKRQCKDVLRLFPEVEDRGLEGKRQRMIWATWKTNVDALSEKARCVLFAFAMFDCVSVPEVLVKGLDPSFLSDELAYAEIVHDELIDGASFLQENKVGESVTFETHRLIREFILLETKSDENRCCDALRRAARIAHEVVKSSGDSMCRKRFRKLLPHLSSLLLFVSDEQFSLGPSIPMPSVFLELFQTTVRALSNVGRSVDATPLCSGWLRLLHEVYGEKRENRHVMDCLGIVGAILRRNGAYAEAEKLLLEYLDICQRLLGNGSDHCDVAYSFCELGEVARKKGQLNAAESWYQKSLDILFRECGKEANHKAIAFAMNRQGRINFDKGSFNEAERWSLRSLNMLRQLYGENANTRQIVQSLYMLGSVCREKGDLDEAERYFQSSLEMERRIYDEEVDTLGISIRLENLGSIAQDRCNYDQATNRYRQCHEMRRRIYGEGVDHVKIAAILYAMAGNDYERGSTREGVRQLKECIDMERRMYGDDCPMVLEHAALLEKWERNTK